MKVVLLDDIVNIGEAGTVAEVKDGYARNYLIPKKLAEMATKDSLNRISLIKRAADVKRSRRMSEAAGKFAELAEKTLIIRMKAGTESRLFGAVTSAMITDEIQLQFGVELDRRHIMLDEPIKHLGEFTVPLRASAEVTGEVRLLVEPEGKKREEIERELVERVLAEDAEKAAAEEAAKAAEAGEGEGEGESAPVETSANAEEAAQAADTQDKYEDEASKVDEQA